MKKLVRSVENRGPVPLNVSDFAVPFYLSPNQKAELFISDIEQGGTVKTIKDAVIELGGKWPKEFALGYMSYDGYRLYYDTTGYQVCVKDQFEAEAKRMGYINGYLWGKEYPTNGRRPELPDELMIDYKNHFHGDRWLKSARIGHLVYESNGGSYPVTAFRITDPRCKPADEVSSNASSQDQSLTHSEEGLTHSEWHERGELPPIGDPCEWSTNDGKVWSVTKLIFKDDHVFLTKHYELYKVADLNVKFRPIRTEREKFIAQAWDRMRGDTAHKETTELLGQLYDLGYRFPVAE